jgi:hypothetical protein
MKAVISGGTGMIGRALAEELADAGHEVVVLTRGDVAGYPARPGIRYARWDGATVSDWGSEINGADAVINLAGENLSVGRWTKQQKQQIINSRVNAGHALADAIRKAAKKPAVFIQASGSGAYGTSESSVFSESDDYGDDFLAGVTRVWEESTKPLESIGVRRVIIRSGVVLAQGKGALKMMMLPFRLFVGGPLGSGRQWLSWIHLRDEVKAIRFLIENPKASGVFNLSAEPVTNLQFAQAAGETLRRPAILRVPGFILRVLLGEMSTMVLEGQNVSSNKLRELGFEFLYPKIEVALDDIVYNRKKGEQPCQESS